jgi:hypothetical protein
MDTDMLAALVPPAQIGRMLTGEQAAKLVKRYESRIPEK